MEWETVVALPGSIVGLTDGGLKDGVRWFALCDSQFGLYFGVGGRKTRNKYFKGPQRYQASVDTL